MMDQPLQLPATATTARRTPSAEGPPTRASRTVTCPCFPNGFIHLPQELRMRPPVLHGPCAAFSAAAGALPHPPIRVPQQIIYHLLHMSPSSCRLTSMTPPAQLTIHPQHALQPPFVVSKQHSTLQPVQGVYSRVALSASQHEY